MATALFAVMTAVATDPTICNTDLNLTACFTDPLCITDGETGCPEPACAALNNIDRVLGARVVVRVDAIVTRVVSNGTEAISIGTTDAYASFRSGTLQNEDGSAFRTVPMVSIRSVTAEPVKTSLVFTNTGRVVFDPALLASFTATLACFPSAAVPDFTDAFNVAIFRPGVVAAGRNDSTSIATDLKDNSLGECVPDGIETVETPTRVTLLGCTEGDESSCFPLSACGANEYEANPGRGKTEDVECASTPPCGPSEVEIVPPTATSARVCVRSAENCRLSDGKVLTSEGCENVTPCNTTDEFMSAVATPLSQPTCKPISPACTASEFESQSPGIERDRSCTAVGTDCGTRPAAVVPRTGVSVPELERPVVGYFQIAAATASTDRLCLPVRICDPTEIEVAAATPTTDRRCVKRVLPPPPGPECDAYGDGGCAEPVEYRSTLPTLIANGVLFFGFVLYTMAVNLRETGSRSGAL